MDKDRNLLIMSRTELIRLILELEDENERLSKSRSDLLWARDGDRMGGGTSPGWRTDEWGNSY